MDLLLYDTNIGIVWIVRSSLFRQTVEILCIFFTVFQSAAKADVCNSVVFVNRSCKLRYLLQNNKQFLK